MATPEQCESKSSLPVVPISGGDQSGKAQESADRVVAMYVFEEGKERHLRKADKAGKATSTADDAESSEDDISPPRMMRQNGSNVERISSPPGAFPIPGIQQEENQEVEDATLVRSVRGHEPTVEPTTALHPAPHSTPAQEATNSDLLVEATLVSSTRRNNDDDDLEGGRSHHANFALGTPVSKEEVAQEYFLNSSRGRCILALLACLLAGMMALIVGLVLGLNNSTSSNGQKETNEAIVASVVTLLPEGTQAELKDASSSQAKALAWLEADPNLADYEAVPERLVQRFALATFYYATGGEEWIDATHWLSYDHHECSWFTATDEPDMQCIGNEAIYILSLEDNNLVGTLPPEIGLLSWMGGLELGENWHLTGSLPTQMGLLTTMQWMVIYFTGLTGTLPSELGEMTSLDELYLAGNFEMDPGTIPTQFGQMTDLYHLFIKGIPLQGSIPSQLGLLTKMTSMEISSSTSLEEVPSDLDLLTSLALLPPSNASSGLTGPLPSELGQLSWMHTLLLQGNRLSGTIPESFQELKLLEIMDLRGNPLVYTNATNNNSASSMPLPTWLDSVDEFLI